MMKRSKNVTLDSAYIAKLASEKREGVSPLTEDGVRFYESKRVKKASESSEASESRPEFDVGLERRR